MLKCLGGVDFVKKPTASKFGTINVGNAKRSVCTRCGSEPAGWQHTICIKCMTPAELDAYKESKHQAMGIFN